MKILLVNKFHYLKGGSETYYFSLKGLLEENGHEVAEFSMKGTENEPSKYSEYFVDNINYNVVNSFLNKIKLAAKLVYSFEAKKKIEKLILDFKPDIIHLHVFQHQLSPSILSSAKKYHIPVVYTAHDFKMICPNYKMLMPSGKICEDCKGGKYYKCIKNRCVKGSLINSLVDTIEAYTHKFLKSYDWIDRIITPSYFYKNKFIEFGIDSNKLRYIPNFLDYSKFTLESSFSNYFIYFGRLSEEKGIETLLKAMRKVNGNLKIVGTGPLENELKKFAEQYELNDKIEFMGYKTSDELKKIVSKAMFVVVPSEWYENAPYSILEAMALGKPVVGSNIGGIPELVKQNETGIIFKANDDEILADKLNLMLLRSDLVENYGKNGKKYLMNSFNKELHYKNILKVYNELIYRR